MNWKKAKTLLIIMFLLVDSLLFYQYWSGKPTKIVTISQNKIQQGIQNLVAQNIKINCEIPTKSKQIPNIKIRYKYFSKEELITAFFLGGADFSEASSEKGYILESADYKITVAEPGVITYHNKKYKETEMDIGAREVAQFQSKAIDLLKRFHISKSDIVIDAVIKEKSEMKLAAKQTYKGILIENTRIEVIGSATEIREATLLICDSIITETERTPLAINGLQALESVANESSPDTIVEVNNIKQGFYFDTKNIEEFDIISIKEGLAYLVWIIETDQEKIYVNAYNGRVIK